MIIACTYENGEVFQHFGHTEQFKLYDVQDGKVVSARVVDNGGAGHEALTVYLKNLGVSKLICGGVGGGAIMALGRMGIETYPGNTGSCDEALDRLLAGEISSSTSSNCDHHSEERGHSCNGGCHH